MSPKPSIRHRLNRLGVVLAAAGVVALSSGTAIAVPAAPKPTSTEISPGTPDPSPPPGGKAPNGAVPGGEALASRGLVLPAEAPALPKYLTASAWILVDLDTGDVLAARDPHGRYQPASILKILTAITVVDNLAGNKVVTVSPQAADSEGSAVGLLAGAKYTVDELFQALMLVSGNDAAAALAEANGGIPQTVAQMNATADQLGAYDTFAQTPSGLDGWQQLTSAYDMALVLRAMIEQPRLVDYDRLRAASYSARTSEYGKVGPYQFDNQSLNFLDSVPGALVAKTGYTDAAQHTYLAADRRDGRTLGVVLLRNARAPLDQFQQAGELFDWGFALKPQVKPVGVLAGPIGPDDPLTPGPAQSLGSAVAYLAPKPSAAPASARGWSIMVPITVAGAGGLWLGCVVIVGRRMLLRRWSRQH